MTLVVVGGGILGLCVAECASRWGQQVTVVDCGKKLAGSPAAAAQLGLKGQSLFRSADFGWKIAGQRMYERWLRDWLPGPDLPSWFRRGVGRERFLRDADVLRQSQRVLKHEHAVVDSDPFSTFCGPSLVDVQAQRKEILYRHEAAVDAPRLLHELRAQLQRRGVFFHSFDARNISLLADLRPSGVVLAAGAWSFEIAREWGLSGVEQGAVASARRLTLGSTLDWSAECSASQCFDFSKHVVETLVDLQGGAKCSLTAHEFGTSITSTSAPLADLGEVRGELLQQVQKAEALLDFVMRFTRFSSLADGCRSHQLRTGLRMRASSQDVVVRQCPRRAGLPPVILFTGANRSGFLYGPALAPRVVQLHIEGARRVH